MPIPFVGVTAGTEVNPVPAAVTVAPVSIPAVEKTGVIVAPLPPPPVTGSVRLES